MSPVSLENLLKRQCIKVGYLTLEGRSRRTYKLLRQQASPNVPQIADP
jgi:hypothetical protein